MITSQKQFKVSEEKLAMLKTSLKAPAKKGVPDVIKDAGKRQLKRLINKIEKELNEFLTLRSNKLSSISIDSVEDLFLAPIRFRIANGMSIETFSRLVGVSARQIARYEDEEYNNINATTFQKILSQIEIHLSGNVELRSIAES